MSSVECRVSKTVRDGKPCGALSEAFICSTCANELETVVAQMPAWMGELAIAATKQAKTFRGGAPRRNDDQPTVPADPEADVPAWGRSRQGRITLPSTPAPIDFDAADLMRLAAGALAEWAIHFGSPGRSTTDHVAWLLSEIDTIRHDRKAPVAHARLTGLAQRIEAAVDNRPPGEFVGHCDAPDVRIVLAAPAGPTCAPFTCAHPSCTDVRASEAVLTPVPGVCGAELYAAENDKTATCAMCGTRHDAVARRRRMSSKVDDEWARPATIAKALSRVSQTVKPDTLYKWIERDRKTAALAEHRRSHRYPLILQVGIDDDGNALYRVGDVRARIQSIEQNADHQPQSA